VQASGECVSEEENATIEDVEGSRGEDVRCEVGDEAQDGGSQQDARDHFRNDTGLWVAQRVGRGGSSRGNKLALHKSRAGETDRQMRAGGGLQRGCWVGGVAHA